MLTGSCHCGKINFTLKTIPNHLTECNCSICYRIGALWAHADKTDIQLSCSDGDLIEYVWGDRLLKFCSCKTCGNTTHWESLDLERSTRMAVNARMVDSALLKDIGRRHFDGADSFEFLD